MLLKLFVFQRFDHFRKPIQIVSRIVIDINSALVVVTDSVDFRAEYPLHIADKFFQLGGKGRVFLFLFFFRRKEIVVKEFLRRPDRQPAFNYSVSHFSLVFRGNGNYRAGMPCGQRAAFYQVHNFRV